MVEQLRVLFLSAEVAPFAKRGGLGDVAGSLPKALQALGVDVRVVMPAYQDVESGRWNVESMPLLLQVPWGDGSRPVGAFRGTLPGSEVPVYFIADHHLFNRPEIYGYGDDGYRFAFFSRAALELMVVDQGWRPHLVHAHDWHTAPAITWLATAGQADPRFANIATLFTIHNLAHQGHSPWELFDLLRIQSYSMREEPYGIVNFMARGIHHATMVNTVSPTYAREIMTPAFGADLDGLLRQRSGDLHGILNGIDTEEWDPAGDKRLPDHFSIDKLDNRARLKQALQAQLGLPQKPDVPLLAMISRLDFQKGLDILGHVIHLLLNNTAGEAQFVVLGTGDPQYEGMLRQLADYHRDKMRAVLAFNAALAPLIYAGSDMFLMPSRFEPCGLSQMISMRYGCVPIVRHTGGLADTVADWQTGFVFGDHTPAAFWHAVHRALDRYRFDQPGWRSMQLAGMNSDFSWNRSAQGYMQLYEWAQSRVRGY
ncbi:MAG: glycogen synthase [Anaerolineales bacterium]|nr:glycogen synthase [Anaerolineales bacterium]MCB0016431.1 glycogen synthase [Anaerolineales bacterium]MCB8958976.1 glycogen synthase [Ardenticatenales bacterium]